MAGVTMAPKQTGRRQPISARLAGLARAVENVRQRRKFDIRQIMLVAGSAAMGLGFVAIILGWYGAAHSSYQFQEIPYLISGGLLGVALVAGGGFLFFAAFLVRMIEENRRYTNRVVQTMARIDRALGAADSNGGIFRTQQSNGVEADPEPTPPSGVTGRTASGSDR
jgi:hypothetical protein